MIKAKNNKRNKKPQSIASKPSANLLALIKSLLKKPLFIFSCTLLTGVLIAFSLGYWYTTIKDNIFAGEGIRDTLTYQGKIVNSDGVPPPDALYNMRFKIYDQSTSGTLLWTETWDGTNQGQAGSKVQVSEGVFTVELNSLCGNWVGSCASNGGVTFQTDSFYIQVELDYDNNGTYEEIFSPRKRFTATPYSMNADKLDGNDSADFILKSGGAMTGILNVPKVVDNSMVAYWQFNGYEDVGGNNFFKDSSPNSLDAQLMNGSTDYDTMLLNGTDGYALVTDDDLLSFGNTPFTLSVWVNFADATNFIILSKGIYNTSGEYKFFTDSDDKLNIQVFDESVSDCYIGRKYDTSSLSGYENSWINLVATYDGGVESSGLKIYVNGQNLDDVDSENNASSYEAMENLAADLYIGRYDTNYAKGKMDDLRINNRALTADEVRRLYESEIRRYLNVENVQTRYLYFTALDQNEYESANMYFDPVLNRVVIDQELYAPEIMPYLENKGSGQDYTHFADDHKILAYDFSQPNFGIIDLEGNSDGNSGGNADFTVAGYSGYGFVFNHADSYISFDDPGFSTTSGTLEMWVKLNNISTSETDYMARFHEAGGVQLALAKQNTADLYAQIGDSGLTDTTYDFPDNSWHHLALTWLSGNLEIFVDGSSVFTDTYSTFTTPTTFLLSYGNSADTSLNGAMDSVALYDDVLTNDEIINHYNSGFNSLYVNGTLNSGLIQTSLANLINLPYSLNYKNISDPVYFENTNAKWLSLAFSEGYGNKTYSYDPDTIYADIYGAIWIRDGFYGPALSFDGVDDYLEIADNDNLDIGTSDFAIEFWINGSADGNLDKKIISKRDGNTGYEIYYNSSSDSIRFFIGDGSNTVDSAATVYDFSDGNWHHFMVNFDRDGNASIFRDGDYWQSSTVNISAVSGSLANTSNLLIAKDASGNFFNGKLDSLIIYDNDGTTPFNYADSLHRVNQGPDIFLVDGKNIASGSTNFGSFNQSANGDAAILAITNVGNTSGYPLSIWTDTTSEIEGNTVYNLIYFGNSFLTGSAEFGNLRWDVTNSRFVFNQGLKVSGDLWANYLSTDDKELMAYDVVRHTLTSDDISAGYCEITWSEATSAKVADMHAVAIDVSDSDKLITDDWGAGDWAISYNGTTIRVTSQAGTWAEGDIISVFIAYEK